MILALGEKIQGLALEQPNPTGFSSEPFSRESQSSPESWNGKIIRSMPKDTTGYFKLDCGNQN